MVIITSSGRVFRSESCPLREHGESAAAQTRVGPGTRRLKHSDQVPLAGHPGGVPESAHHWPSDWQISDQENKTIATLAPKLTAEHGRVRGAEKRISNY